MNTLEEILQHDLVIAMKTKDERGLCAIRSIKKAIQEEKTKGTYHELTDDKIVNLIQGLAKQHNDSIQMFTDANRIDLVNAEKAELEVLKKYLPKMMTADELSDIIDEIIHEGNFSGMGSMGKIMQILKEKYSNQYDGKVASTIVRSKLSN